MFPSCEPKPRPKWVLGFAIAAVVLIVGFFFWVQQAQPNVVIVEEVITLSRGQG